MVKGSSKKMVKEQKNGQKCIREQKKSNSTQRFIKLYSCRRTRTNSCTFHNKKAILINMRWNTKVRVLFFVYGFHKFLSEFCSKTFLSAQSFHNLFLGSRTKKLSERSNKNSLVRLWNWQQIQLDSNAYEAANFVILFLNHPYSENSNEFLILWLRLELCCKKFQFINRFDKTNQSKLIERNC